MEDNKPNYIELALAWFGHIYYSGGKWHGCWVKLRDLNKVTCEGRVNYIYPGGKVLYQTIVPYEDWMEEYIGTEANVPEMIKERQTKLL